MDGQWPRGGIKGRGPGWLLEQDSRSQGSDIEGGGGGISLDIKGDWLMQAGAVLTKLTNGILAKAG